MCPQRLWLLKPSPGNVWLMPSITTLENSWFGPMIIFRLKQTHIHIHSHYYNFTYIHSHLNAFNYQVAAPISLSKAAHTLRLGPK